MEHNIGSLWILPEESSENAYYELARLHRLKM